MSDAPDPDCGLIRTSREFLERTIRCLEEADGAFRATPESLSVTEQLAHTAQTVDWFLDGAERGSFDMDFAAMEQQMRAVPSLAEAKAWFQRAMGRAETMLAEKPASFWTAPLDAGPILGGEPKRSVLGGIADHNAHHRGSLAVLARLCGHTPAMPYADEG